MSRSVLLVDDFEPFIQVIGSLLPPGRFQIAGRASNGLEAVEKARATQPNLMLLDVGLPGLNGIEVAKRVKKLAPGTTILMVSQDSAPEIVTEALDAGALGYVHKQRAHRELLTAIETVLAGRRFVSDGLLDNSYAGAESSPVSPCHRVFFHANDSELVAGLGRFIAEALTAGSPVLSVVTESHRQSIMQTLRQRGLDVERAVSLGRCVWLDADNDSADAAHVSAATLAFIAEFAPSKSMVPKAHIALCGELAGLLWAQGRTGEALKIERWCDDLAKTCDLEILCAYPAGQAPEPSEESDAICAIHSLVH